MSALPLVLDLDLDFFLDDIRLFRSSGRATDLYPWTKDQFSGFLETRCGLSANSSIPGRVFKRHHQAFYFWRQLVQEGRVSTPFHVVHVDAHADLGHDLFNAFGVLQYLSQSVLSKSVETRQSPLRGHKGLWETNYLLFAIACHWVSEITFVTHPAWRDDFHPYFVREENGKMFVELAMFPPDVLNPVSFDFWTAPRLSVDVSVSLTTVPGDAFRARAPFAVASLSTSPNYTPPAADALIDVFRGYISEVD